jgi:hypothetical protein
MSDVKYVALKPFNTSNRKFAVGQEVKLSDDISPHSFADFKTRGFIGEESKVAPAKAAPSAKAEA